MSTRRRRLSSRAVRRTIACEQRWIARDARVWTVRQVHRKDGLAAMQGPAGELRYVRFSELARGFTPAPGLS